jgi:hypothetical protein
MARQPAAIAATPSRSRVVEADVITLGMVNLPLLHDRAATGSVSRPVVEIVWARRAKAPILLSL